jgi:hypothetical protein
VGLERGPLSLLSTTEEILDRKSSASGLENWEYGCREPSRWPRGNLYPKNLALTLPKSSIVGIVRSWTQATEFFSYTTYGAIFQGLVYSSQYRHADNSRPLYFTVSVWERVYATDLSLLQRETRERERETSKCHVREAHSMLITTVLLPQRLSCYWGKVVSLRMLTNLRLADLRLTTAQQRTTGQNLPSNLYTAVRTSDIAN